MSHHTQERDDGYPPVTVHRRVRVGDEVRVTAGDRVYEVGIVRTFTTLNALVDFDGEREWILKARLEPTQPRQRPGEKSEDIKARLAAKRGNDGLTDAERQEHAEHYRATVMRPLDEQERDDINAWLAAKRAQDPTDPANLTPLVSDLGEKPPTLVAVPPQARTSSLAEWDRAESNGERIGHNRAVVAIQRTLAAETRRIRERGISETDEAYLEGIEKALDVVREMGGES